MDYSRINANTSGDFGGGIALPITGTLTINNSTIDGNMASGITDYRGGGLYII